MNGTSGLIKQAQGNSLSSLQQQDTMGKALGEAESAGPLSWNASSPKL